MTYSASYTCHGNSVVSYIVAYSVIIMSQYLWHGVKGITVYDPGQLIPLLLNSSWLLFQIHNITLQEAFSEPRMCQGHSEDDGQILYGNPSLEAQLVASFATFVVLFNLFRTKRIRKNHLFSLTFLVLIVAWGLWWTSNYEFRHVAFGIIVGTIHGIILFVGIYFFWAEDFPALLNLKLFKWYGLKDSICVPAKGLSMYCDEDQVGINSGNFRLYYRIGLVQNREEEKEEKRKKGNTGHHSSSRLRALQQKYNDGVIV